MEGNLHHLLNILWCSLVADFSLSGTKKCLNRVCHSVLHFSVGTLFFMGAFSMFKESTVAFLFASNGLDLGFKKAFVYKKCHSTKLSFSFSDDSWK